MSDPRPLIAHVVFRFGTGGLENGIVNLINHMPAERWRHAVVALKAVDDSFARRLSRSDVQLISLHKPPGQGLRAMPALWRTFRSLSPDIVHTRNIAALEAQLPAMVAGVRARVHSEHGRDVDDEHLSRLSHQLTRRVSRLAVHQYIALSTDLANHLRDSIGVPATRLQEICNGVDTCRFSPSDTSPVGEEVPPRSGEVFVFGTVGRMQAIKNQTLLVDAFIALCRRRPDLRPFVRLSMIGDGPLRSQCMAALEAAGLSERAWLPGERSDVPSLMRTFDCFVLSSRAEGISNTILEAMATGLPVIATHVGGNAQLVDEGVTGLLVPSADVESLAGAMERLAYQRSLATRMGQAGLERVRSKFSLQAMVAQYEDVYLRCLVNPVRGTL